jgi:hypothetical protein
MNVSNMTDSQRLRKLGEQTAHMRSTRE